MQMPISDKYINELFSWLLKTTEDAIIIANASRVESLTSFSFYNKVNINETLQHTGLPLAKEPEISVQPNLTT